MTHHTQQWAERRAELAAQLPNREFDLDGRPRGIIEEALCRNGYPPLRDIVREARIRSIGWADLSGRIRALTSTDTHPNGYTVSAQSLITWFPDLNVAPHVILELPDSPLLTTC